MGIVLLDMAVSINGLVCDAKGRSLYPIEQMKNTEPLNEVVRTTGAVVMDRQWFEMAGDDFSGYEYQVPVFVITDEIPEQRPAGENEKRRFFFITEGIETAIEHARRAAAHLNVTIVGGPLAASLCANAKLLDEVLLRHIPVIVEGGQPLFTDLVEIETRLKILRSSAFASRIDIRYRFQK